MRKSYREYCERGRKAHGEKFSEVALDPRFVRYFESGERIRIDWRGCGEILTGTVGATTGWEPCFLLIRAANHSGSSWTLAPGDRILAVKRGRDYVEVRA